MFVTGIDPGLSRCGYGTVTPGGGPHGLTAVAAGVIETDPGAPVAERLRILLGELRSLFAERPPDVVVVERVFFQVNAKTAMSVGQASGMALVAAAELGCDIAEYTANEVKMALVGYGGASKEQVQRMVASLLGLAAPPAPPDVADALALAACHLGSMALRRSVDVALESTTGGRS
jgi:crossover junction endodeoxyribonuclease RuvC